MILTYDPFVWTNVTQSTVMILTYDPVVWISVTQSAMMDKEWESKRIGREKDEALATISTLRVTITTLQERVAHLQEEIGTAQEGMEEKDSLLRRAADQGDAVRRQLEV